MTTVYCGIGDLQGRLGSTLDTEQALSAITKASRAIDRHCGRRFYPDATATARVYRIHAGWRQQDRALRSIEQTDPSNWELWVDDISSTTDLVVKTDDNNDGTFETTWVVGTDFQLEPLNQVSGQIEGHAYTHLLALIRPWPVDWYGRPLIEVTARWGWEDIPETITSVCIDLAVREVSNPVGVAREVIGGYQVQYESSSTIALTGSDMEQLNDYARDEIVFA